MTTTNNNSSNFPLRLSLFIDAVDNSTLKVKECKAITGGGLGKQNSKMPGRTYGISAWRCKTGQKLAKIKGSVCSMCYAMTGNYKMSTNVREAFIKRADSITHPLWAEAMAVQIRRYSTGKVFRWHDTGDIQTLEHLLMVVMVAHATPDTRHWIPTREVAIIKQLDRLVQAGQVTIPSNLCVRVSSHFVGQKPWRTLPEWCNTSTVSWEDAPVTCPAPQQDGKCLDCRKCWDRTVPNTNYIQH